MIRMAKLTDYGILVLRSFALQSEGTPLSAREIAAHTHIPLPTVSKVLKVLTKKNFLTSTRGTNGGYVLTRKPEAISMAQVIAALEGPIAVTDCNTDHGNCEKEATCPTKSHWLVINHAIQDALEKVPLSRMVQKAPTNMIQVPIYEG